MPNKSCPASFLAQSPKPACKPYPKSLNPKAQTALWVSSAQVEPKQVPKEVKEDGPLATQGFQP